MFSETIELRGHIIDSLILPKVLDEILTRGGNFKITEVRIGQQRADQSFARIEVSAPTSDELDEMMLRLRLHGAEIPEKGDAQLAISPRDGVFPADFFVTSNQQTFVRIGGKEFEVTPVLRDSAIAFDRAKKRASALRFADVKKGMEIVVGHQGIRIVPVQRATSGKDIFQTLTPGLSAQRPKGGLIKEVAREFEEARKTNGKILVVAGASVVHTGAAEYLEQMINWGYVSLMLSGNALAVYDIEAALYGTVGGVNLEENVRADSGHENHLRAINTVRCAGGIAKSVEKGTLTRGIMHACVKNKTEVLLIGSIRDEGPLPEVVTDMLEGQRLMREKLEGVSFALLLSTMLHSSAAASLLPPKVKTLVVDIDPGAVAKLTDQQRFHALGLVTDMEPFLRELVACLGTFRKKAK
ncbi:MAG: TIGR00300 family protein [Verrucomicrobiota bacterium]